MQPSTFDTPTTGTEVASQGDQDGGVGKALADASALKECPGGVEGSKPLQHGFRFCISVLHQKGQKPLDLSSVLKRKIKPAFVKLGIVGVGWHTFRHTVGTLLADMGEDQLTIRDYLRHSKSQRDQQVFASDVEDQASRPGEIGRRDPADGIFVREQINRDPVILHPRRRRSCGSSRQIAGKFVGLEGWISYWTQMDPNC